MTKAKLTVDGNNYFINKKKDFNGQLFKGDVIEQVFEFAFNMTFGEEGEHRGNRSGGQYSRKNGELFANTFQGKLAEFAVYQVFKENEVNTNLPDLNKWKLGLWDENDFIIKSKKISVKSAAFFSNLLLLETKDWNNDGVYIPNNVAYDFHIFCRIKPDLKKVLAKERLLYSNTAEQENLKAIIDSLNFEFDIPGFLTREELKSNISNSFTLPRNAMLNGTTKMDANNYYCQTGDLNQIQTLIELLK